MPTQQSTACPDCHGNGGGEDSEGRRTWCEDCNATGIAQVECYGCTAKFSSAVAVACESCLRPVCPCCVATGGCGYCHDEWDEQLHQQEVA